MGHVVPLEWVMVCSPLDALWPSKPGCPRAEPLASGTCNVGVRSRARGRCHLPGRPAQRATDLSGGDHLWVDTREILDHLRISRSTLDHLRQEGVLVERRHYVKKNPLAIRGVFLWHRQRCDLALHRF